MTRPRTRPFYVALLSISIAASVLSLAALALRPEETGRWRIVFDVGSLLLVVFSVSRLSRDREDGPQAAGVAQRPDDAGGPPRP